jgi:hypothetical protein
MTDADQSGKGISLAGMITLISEEGVNKVRSIGDERLRVDVKGGDGKDGVLPHIGMSMLKTGTCWRQQRLDELGLPKLAKEPKRVAPNVFVGMLEVISDAIAANVSALRPSGEINRRVH